MRCGRACAQAREVRRLDPIERALAIQPNVADQQDAQEDKHGYQPVSAQLAVLYRPRK